MVKLRKWKKPFFRGKKKSRSESGSQRKDCLNDNILTEQAPVEQSSQHRYIPKLKTTMTRPFQFLQKKSSSESTAENSLVVPSNEAPVNNTKDAKNKTRMFGGVCGQAAAETMNPRPESPPPRVDDRIEAMLKQLHELQGQVYDLNHELDFVHVEKEDAISKLDKMINQSKTKKGVDHTDLEEIRMILTAGDRKSVV